MTKPQLIKIKQMP